VISEREGGLAGIAGIATPAMLAGGAKAITTGDLGEAFCNNLIVVMYKRFHFFF